MSIRTELNQLKKKLTVGSRLVYIPIKKDECFFDAAQRLLESNINPSTISLKTILKEIDGNSMGLPSLKDKKKLSHNESFSLVNLLSGESFMDCTKRLKAYRITPEIYS